MRLELGEVSDEALMDRYARGDGAAFEELFARYEGRAFAFFLRRTASEDRAVDLYQELFLRIHRSRDRYDPTRPFAPWFFQIARRLLIDELRRGWRCREGPLAEGEESPPTDARSPERSAADAEEAQVMLGQLSEVEGYVLVSTKVHGREYSELAEELGKSVAATKKLASRALQRLRERSRRGEELPALP